MDPIESKFASEYNQFTKRKRYNRYNIARKFSRSKRDEVFYPDLSLPNSDTLSFDEERMNHPLHPKKMVENPLSLNRNADEIRLAYTPRSSSDEGSIIYTANTLSHEDDLDLDLDVQSVEDDKSSNMNLSLTTTTYLHNHTIHPTYEYCETFASLSRRAHLCKSHVNDFLSFIKSGLPVPNNLPSTEKQLLALLNIEDLFTKRSICLSCHVQIDYLQTGCGRCNAEATTIAHVYVFQFVLDIDESKKSSHEPFQSIGMMQMLSSSLGRSSVD